MRVVQSSKQVGRVPCTLHFPRPLIDDWLQGQINMQINWQGAALLWVLERLIFKIHYGFIKLRSQYAVCLLETEHWAPQRDGLAVVPSCFVSRPVQIMLFNW